MDAAMAKQYISEGNYGPVLALDQLGQQRKTGRVFQGFQEAEIDFKPTYKYDPGTDNWDSRYFLLFYLTTRLKYEMRFIEYNTFKQCFFISDDMQREM